MGRERERKNLNQVSPPAEPDMWHRVTYSWLDMALSHDTEIITWAEMKTEILNWLNQPGTPVPHTTTISIYLKSNINIFFKNLKVSSLPMRFLFIFLSLLFQALLSLIQIFYSFYLLLPHILNHPEYKLFLKDRLFFCFFLSSLGLWSHSLSFACQFHHVHSLKY